jgi:hypothetical protein
MINQFLGTAPNVVPVAGMGCTELLYTDRHACTITRVSPSGKTFWFKRDHAKRTDDRGMSESQEWEYTPNPDAPELCARWTKRGWAHKGTRIGVGYRSEYYDFSF